MHKSHFLVVSYFYFKNLCLSHFISQLLILLSKSNKAHNLELFIHRIAGYKGLVVKVAAYNHWHNFFFFFLNMQGLEIKDLRCEFLCSHLSQLMTSVSSAVFPPIGI